MSNIWTKSPELSEAEQDTLFDRLFEELEQLNAHMHDDQADIDRLKMETRVLSEHSDLLLFQIEAKLGSFRKAS